MANQKKPALGKALGSLLGDIAIAAPTAIASEKQPFSQEDGLLHLAIELLTPSQYQPRRIFDPTALEELASSIRAQGILQPIAVRKLANRQYEIIAGERRWRAAQLAGLTQVPVIVKDISDQAAMALALIENIQREDLNPMEEAMALQRLIAEFKMTHQEAADAVGKSRVTVSNLLRLMGLHEEVKNLLQNGELEMGHARALLALDPNKQRQAARTVVSKHLTVRQTERLVQITLQPPQPSISKPMDPNIKKLESELSERLGAVVKIDHQSNGKGSVTINYHSVDELEGILRHMK